MSKLFISIVYFAFACTIFRICTYYLVLENTVPAQWISIAKIFNWIPYLPGTHLFVYFIALFGSMTCILRPYRLVRILTALFFILLLSIRYSHEGRHVHGEHIWLYISIFMCFFKPSESLTSLNNFVLIRLMQFSLFAQYFVAGLWKFRTIVDSGFQVSASEMALEHIAYIEVMGLKNNYFIQSFFIQNPSLLGASLLGVIGFQLLCIVPIILQRYIIVFGFGAMVFQLSTELLLGITFISTGMALLLLFFLTEVILKQEKINVQ